MAALDVRNANLLRNKIPNLVVPLGCSVDYLGLRYECMSIIPATINSLVYGSDLNDLLFKTDDPHASQMAEAIASALNLKPHFIRERATQKLKQTALPFSV